MEKEQIITELKLLWKGVAYIGILFLTGVAIKAIYSVTSDFEYGFEHIFSLILFTSLLIASIISFFYIYNYRIIINEAGIEKAGFFSNYSIRYSEIDKITFDVMIVNVCGKGKTISLGNLYSNFDEAVEYVVKKTKGRENIIYEGKGNFFNNTFEV